MNGIVAFHLGAGYHSEKKKASYKKLCVEAAQKSLANLGCGATALDLVADCTVILENSPLTNAGTGSNLTTDGTVECDASIMEGNSCVAGAVGALSGIRNPVLVAKSLALEQMKVQSLGRVMPCMLVGQGAYSFAKDQGIPTVDPSCLITARSRKDLKKCKRKLERYNESVQTPSGTEHQPSSPIFTVEGTSNHAKRPKTTNDCEIEVETRLDTVGAVAVDVQGQCAASCSSGGVLIKLPGRVGQAGVVGAGCWAEGPVAVTVSGNGEDLVRTSLCKEVAKAIMTSNDLASTLVQTITKLFLESKYLTTGSSKLCGVLAVKKDPEGGGEVAWAHTTQSMAIGFISSNLSSPKFQISHLPKSAAPGSSVNVQGEEAKKKWKSLKDAFRKQMKNVPAARSGDEGGAPTKPNWKFYDSLCFLRDIFMPSTTYGNIGQNFEPVENETENDEQSSSSPLPSPPPPHQSLSRKECENKKSSSSPLPSTPPLPQISSRKECENKQKRPKSSKSDVEDKVLEMEQRKLDAILSMQQEEPKSDDHHFFLSLLPMIEPLSHIEKLRLRAKFQNVLLEHLEGLQQTNTQHPSSSGYGIHHADTSRSRFHPYYAAYSRDPRIREARAENRLEPFHEQTGSIHPQNDDHTETHNSYYMD